MRQVKKMAQRGLLDTEKEDPFALFVASTNIRYCYYSDTHKILGNTFGMCVLQVRCGVFVACSVYEGKRCASQHACRVCTTHVTRHDASLTCVRAFKTPPGLDVLDTACLSMYRVRLLPSNASQDSAREPDRRAGF